VLFIIRRDPSGYFRFAASQTDEGRKLISGHGLGSLADHSIVLLKEGNVYSKSGAALRIAGKLRGLWPAFKVFFVLPAPVRDYFYEFVARNRYRLYGKRDSCFIPDPSIRERFL
jgi:predicted DCC family thiol-disulfide oxidoreductase YuxK